jgi:hypothetical protein
MQAVAHLLLEIRERRDRPFPSRRVYGRQLQVSFRRVILHGDARHNVLRPQVDGSACPTGSCPLDRRRKWQEEGSGSYAAATPL